MYNASIEDWIIILELAQQWHFEEIKYLVVTELEKQDLSDIERIVLYHKYGIDRTILVPRYSALCARQEPLSYQEGLQLGMEVALTIARARECARARGKSVAGGSRNPVPANIEDQEMTSLIVKIFRIAPEGERFLTSCMQCFANVRCLEGTHAAAGKRKGKAPPADY